MTYWNYNHELIGRRREIVWNGYRVTPAQPRIDLSVFLSSKGNLIVEWCPSGSEHGKLTPVCDWARWYMEKKRRVDVTSRPSNELLFVQDVSSATRHFPGMYEKRWYSPEHVMVDTILLQTTAAMVEELKERLKFNFEVRMVTDIFTEWEEVESKNWPRSNAEVLAIWTIENVAEHDERTKAAEAERARLQELEEIERFQEVNGCSIEVFIKALTEPDVERANRTSAVAAHQSRPRKSIAEEDRLQQDDISES